MAHVPLTPIGRPRDQVVDDSTFREHREALLALEQKLQERRADVHQGWGPKYQDRVHAKSGHHFSPLLK